MTTQIKKRSIEVDPVALGLTRPAMFMGVNLKMFFINLACGFIFCIDFHTFYGLVLFGLCHLFMVRLSIKEPKFASIWRVAFLKTPPILNALFWGKTNSYEPW